MATGTPMENFRIAASLYEAGILLMRQNLIRRHPDCSDEELEQLLLAWMGAGQQPSREGTFR